MAFRIEATVSALIMLGGFVYAQEYKVHHDHWRGIGAGTLTVSDTGLKFKEDGKQAEHSREWTWEDIQQLKLTANRLEILTYEDAKWQMGRDRDYSFLNVPAELIKTAAPLFRASLNTRFVDATASDVSPVWKASARLQKKFAGVEGVLSVARNQVSFLSKRPGESRSWRIEDIDSISSSGPYDLTITTYERARLSRADRSDFHFQLKQRLDADRYDEVWRSVNQAKGLKDLNTLLPIRREHHETENR